MPYIVERHQHTISSWVATINCEGSAFVQMLRDVPEHSRVAHTQAKMMEIVRARARRIADNSGDKSYRSVHEIREEQIMLGEMLVEQIAADVCHALLNLQADPWKSSNPKPSLDTQTSINRKEEGKLNWQAESQSDSKTEDESDEEAAIRIIIPEESSKYAPQWIEIDGKKVKVLATVVTALRAIVNARSSGAKIYLGHFDKLSKTILWLASELTRDFSQKTINKLATYNVTERVKKTIRVKTVSNDLLDA